MGTLLGHVLPGSFFLFFGLWRLIQISFRLHLVGLIALRRRLRRGRIGTYSPPVGYFASATYPCCLRPCAGFPLEGAAKILVTGIGMGGELFASTDYGRAGKVVFMGDIQHVTMYALFCVSGIVDVLSWKRIRICPPGMDFLALANAFAGEWILFSRHLHGRTDLDVALHTLLLYVVAATVLAVVAEYRWNETVMTSLVTAYLLMLQGTWFVQAGVVLYARFAWTAWLRYGLEESDAVVMATVLFAWHAAGNFVLGLVMLVLFGHVMRFSCGGGGGGVGGGDQWIEKLWAAHVMSSSVSVTMTSPADERHDGIDKTSDEEEESV